MQVGYILNFSISQYIAIYCIDVADPALFQPLISMTSVSAELSTIHSCSDLGPISLIGSTVRQATSTNTNQHEPTESYWHLSTSYWSGTESLRGSCSSHPEMGRGEGDEGRPWDTNLAWTFGNSWTYYDLLHNFYICSICSILFIVSGGLMDSLNFQPQAWSLMFKYFGSGDGRILALGSGQCARQFLTVKLL